MERMIVHDGKIMLFPEFKEIPKDSVLGLKFIIRKGKESIKEFEREIKAMEAACKRYEEMAEKGILTAGQSVAHNEIRLAKLQLTKINRENEIKRFEVDLEIAEVNERRSMIAEELAKLTESSKEIVPSENIEPTETKAQILTATLFEYDFFELQTVKELSKKSQETLIEMIAGKGLPYSIAMFEYLGFLKYLAIDHFQSKYELNKAISKWLNSDISGRSVKGNISVLFNGSKENRAKYTAHLHRETVKNDYQKLK